MTSATEANQELVRRYLNAFNNQDYETLAEVIHEDIVEHGIHEELHGPEETIEYLRSHFEMFPDYSGSTDEMIAAGDTVVVRYTASGTHSGEYKGVEPTGREAEWTGIVIYRIDDDKITEVWLEEDRIGLLEQLGAVDPPAHLRL